MERAQGAMDTPDEALVEELVVLLAETHPEARFQAACALAVLAEAEGLQPAEGDEAEAVVHLGELDVRRRDVGARPHLRGRVTARHRGEVVELVPRRPTADRRPDRFHLDRRLAQVVRDVGARHDQGRAAVARDVAVEQAERRRDHGLSHRE